MTAILVLILRIAAATALLGFLGWAFFTVWRELNEQLGVLSKQQIPKMQISWNHETEPITRLFTIPIVVIGRDPECDCPIPNDTISARHAKLSFHHNQWWLEDLVSTNGTFINEERVAGPTVIISGDEVRCGHVTLSVEIQNL